jgi:hypothetical protein
MQGARLSVAMSSRDPSACNSPYHFPGGIARHPQLQTTSSPIPITAGLQGPPSAPPFCGQRPTLSPSIVPAIEVPQGWLSAGAQPLNPGAPWGTYESATTRTDHEGVSGTPESLFDMDPVIQTGAEPTYSQGAEQSFENCAWLGKRPSSPVSEGPRLTTVCFHR